MSIDYIEMRGVATQLLKEFGEACVVTTNVGGAYDVESGAMVAGAVAARNGWCVNEEVGFIFGAYSSKGSRRASAVEVEMGDRVVMINAEAVVLVGDVITISGEAWRCLSAEAIAPTSIVVMYTAHLRK